MPFTLDDRTLKQGLNFTLTSDNGDIDLLGELAGVGSYDDAVADAVQREIFGYKCLCLSLKALIHAKRAAGRPKDIEALAELEALTEESEDSSG